MILAYEHIISKLCFSPKFSCYFSNLNSSIQPFKGIYELCLYVHNKFYMISKPK